MKAQTSSKFLTSLNPALEYVGLALVALGTTFVLSSFYKLGIVGTYLGDYFGFLMKERVESFPFNVVDDPMYVGSTMIFTGFSFQ